MAPARSGLRPSYRETATRHLFTALRQAQTPADRDRLIERLVTVNLPLCDGLAGRYANRGAEIDDLIQVARTALLLAIDRFQPQAGVGFASFAVPTIVGELKRHFRDHCWMVRPPRRIQELRARAVAVREEVEQQLGREPSTEELAGELDVDPGELAESLASASSYRPLSLDAPLHGSSGDDAGSLLGEPGDLATQLAERITVRRVVAGLPPRDRQIIVWRFVEECTQHEIGRRLGQSQMQVSRHLARILQQVRHSLEPAAALAG